ncbi:MAG: 1-phosphofructokinase [Clostridia bacterium]|nr:1-phosphofructokinase [Clostridia bacterium]
MIYTVTFNPSLDLYMRVQNLNINKVNRSTSDRLCVGGKGINVSLALKELGNDSVALGFEAGFTGDAICRYLNESGLKYDFIRAEGLSRINVKVKGTAETDINGIGVDLTEADVQKLERKLKKLLKPGDWLVICGSVPSSLPSTVYGDLMYSLRRVKDVKVVVDAFDGLLTSTLKYRPFLIKPNIFELCDIFGLTSIPDTKKITECARELQKQGARNVIVSMGGAGAVMVTEQDQSMYVRAATGELVNSVGAGDSMIAGFIHEYLESANCFSALNFATAAGTACAFTADLATKAQIEYIERLML